MVRMNFIGLSILLFYVLRVHCQSDITPVSGQHYILRSCISTAELIRNHRKASKDEKILLMNTVAEPPSPKQSPMSSKRFRTINTRGKKRKMDETSLRTLEIHRSAKSSQLPLLFTRKGSFPIILPDRHQHQRSPSGSDIIFIKSSV